MTPGLSFSNLFSAIVFLFAQQTSMAEPAVCAFQQALTLEEVEIGNLLTWSASTSDASIRFNVQRSPDGISFTSIGEVVAIATPGQEETYQFLDLEIGQTVAYYRLVCMQDGQSVLITPAVFSHRKTQNNWRIIHMTNTVTQAPFRFTLESVMGSAIRVSVTDLHGLVCQEKTVELQSGRTEVELDLGALSVGRYRLDLHSGEEIEHLILQKIDPARMEADGYAIRE